MFETYIAVSAIILMAGVLGGVVSVAMGPAGDPAERWPAIAGAILPGIGASALVPLFLQTVSSTLLTDLFTTVKPANWFVFGGFCLLAAITARRFIETLSEKVLRDLKEVKQQASDADAKAGKAKNDAAEAKMAAAEATEQASQIGEKSDALANRTERAEVNSQAALDMTRFQLNSDPPPVVTAADREASPRVAGDAPAATAIEPGPDPDDPWKGAFGGEARRNGRVLEADVRQLDALWATITLRVKSETAERPLTGVVRFFLHPSFDKNPAVPVVDGEATLTVPSWGAFTVGALADEGRTRLELDLAAGPGGSAEWRTR